MPGTINVRPQWSTNIQGDLKRGQEGGRKVSYPGGPSCPGSPAGPSGPGSASSLSSSAESSSFFAYGERRQSLPSKRQPRHFHDGHSGERERESVSARVGGRCYWVGGCAWAVVVTAMLLIFSSKASLMWLLCAILLLTSSRSRNAVRRVLPA